ncbi:MAG TPA: glycosyltransferase family 2 protein [Acidobacteriaceae bacterium]
MSVNLSFRPYCDAPPKVAIVIPAYRPTSVLEDLLEYLVEFGVPAILLVDDGSGPTRQRLFERIAREPRVHVLRHAANQGKGMALKTGMRYFLEHLRHYTGLVTADADGRHSVDDILRVARALHRAPQLAILGARTFSGGATASSSRRTLMGNRMMAFLFRAFTGVPLSDAQTGLRGLPTSLLPSLLALPGSRYEYEMSVLTHIARSGHPLAEQPIRTVSAVDSSDSDFRLVADSWRVFRTLISSPQPCLFKPDVAALAECAADFEHDGSDRPLHTN